MRWLWEELLGIFGVRRSVWGNPKDPYCVVIGPGVLPTPEEQRRNLRG